MNFEPVLYAVLIVIMLGLFVKTLSNGNDIRQLNELADSQLMQIANLKKGLGR